MDEDKTVNNTEVCAKWVEAGIFTTQEKAERAFQNQIGERFFMRGSRFIYHS